jgi:hypothetical protein
MVNGHSCAFSTVFATEYEEKRKDLLVPWCNGMGHSEGSSSSIRSVWMITIRVS